MVDRKLDELASDIDDASTVVEELQEERDAEAADEKLNELHATLEEASNTINDIVDDDE
jgi:outer membrane murein-binding lipoprotein Lpp